MGNLISATAALGRIEDHVRTTLRTALATKGDIGKAADSRLSAAVANIDVTAAQHKAAAEAEATAWAAVMAEDAKSNRGILMVRDTMWNLLGRARHTPEMAQVFPGGATTYTAGDPHRRPTLMRILQSRIASATSTRWTDAMRTQWVADIEALRVSYEAALAAHQPLDGAATVAEAAYHTAVHTAHACLRTYKKDLQVLGLTEAQIHEIIPDDAVAAKHAPPVTQPQPPPANNNAGGAAA